MTTKYPGWRLENCPESSTATWGSPRRAACFASPSAPARPFVAGTESRTIVQPARPAGHAISAAFGLGLGTVGVVLVPVVAVVVAVVGGSGAVSADVVVVGPAFVRTIVFPAELESSASQSAEATPATTATTSASSVGQTQSPGYQPTRRRQRAPSLALRPGLAGSRSPHSRQYSWSSAYEVLQRGQRRSSSEGGTQPSCWSAAWNIVSSEAGCSASSGGSTVRPQLAQKLASAGSGCPQSTHTTTAPAPTGRPQLAQK